MTQILVVDDQEFPRQAVVDLIEHEFGIPAAPAASATEALATLAEQAFDLVITDLKMDEMDGIQLLERVRADHAGTEVIVVTGYGSIEDAVEAMRIGASDFVVKDGLSRVLPIKITKALENRSARHERDRLGEENRYLREEIGDRFGEIVGDSDVIRQVLATVSKVSATDSSVLIYGESGTGKELFARAIHRQSNRSEGPFVRVNCGALPRELVESELFGHEKGAFTGAVRQKKGRFELAQGGTIFLDEIADLPLDTQVNLLRVLQEKEFDRVGGEQTLTADVRVVAATNVELEQRIQDGRFRQDLYYRLARFTVTSPPLRERPDDIPLLADHFAQMLAVQMGRPTPTLSAAATCALRGYAFPGNVRELRNLLERALLELGDGDVIEADHLRFPPTGTHGSGGNGMAGNGPGGSNLALPLDLDEAVAAAERWVIEQALAQCDGNVSAATRLLGTTRNRVYRIIGQDGKTQDR